jgi:membrane fusion protein, copper/silver efflux system
MKDVKKRKEELKPPENGKTAKVVSETEVVESADNGATVESEFIEFFDETKETKKTDGGDAEMPVEETETGEKERIVVKVSEEKTVLPPKKKSKRFFVIGLLLVLLIAAPLIYYNRNRIFQPAPMPDEHTGHTTTTTMENMPPGSVMIDPAKQQLIGVKIGEADLMPLTRTLRTVGKVTFDETKIVRIHPKIEGWVENVFVNFTGMPVKKGQPLLSIYSPDLVSTQQEFLISLKAKKTLGKSDFPEVANSANSLYEASRKRLQLWDIPDSEINRIERSGETVKALTLYAPSGGYVLTKNVFQRQKITPDTELYSIADLSKVWVIADVYEYEMKEIRTGMTATMNLAYYPGETFTGKITYIYPQLDPQTRTLKARIEFPNPGLKLKPDMYADVNLQIVYPRQISVPEEAVLDSGEEQIIFVSHGNGHFEPRRVLLGAKVDNRYIVLSGLQAGEKIVVSGNFMIDSESRLKSSMGGMNHGGMKMDEQK